MHNNKQLAYTMIKETRLKDQIGNKVRAGSWYKAVNINHQEQILVVLPQQLIAMQRWMGGLYGTSKWVFYVFRTGSNKDEVKNMLTGVYPKVDLLFFCYGTTRVKKTLKIIDQMKKLGLKFKDLSNEYWIYQHARIQTGKPLILPNYV